MITYVHGHSKGMAKRGNCPVSHVYIHKLYALKLFDEKKKQDHTSIFKLPWPPSINLY